MKGLYYDQQKRCHFLEVRVPKEVIAIFGLKPGSKRKETFPQSVGADEADHRAVKPADMVLTPAEAVELWVERRQKKYKKATGKKARGAVQRILDRLVVTLGHDNLALVTERDLEKHEKGLGGEVGPGGWRSHAM